VPPRRMVIRRGSLSFGRSRLHLSFLASARVKIRRLSVMVKKGAQWAWAKKSALMMRQGVVCQVEPAVPAVVEVLRLGDSLRSLF